MSLPSWQTIPITIAISLSGFLISPNALPNETQTETKETQPETSAGDARPPGHSRPGGDLGDPDRCEADGDRELIAIVPYDSEQNTTASAEPVLWIYVPYPSEQVLFGELVLVDEKQTKYIRQISFDLPQTPGFVSIDLRQSSEEALQEGDYYRWYVTMNCKEREDSDKEPKDDIDGWVRLLSDATEAETSPWYDRANSLATSLMEDPGNRALLEEWRELLESLGLGDFANEPIVGPVQIIEEQESEGDLSN